MSAIHETLTVAVAKGQLLESAKANIIALLDGTTSPVAALAINELLQAGAWDELNDRFSRRWLSVPEACAVAPSVA
jgi:phosphoglucomutase